MLGAIAGDIIGSRFEWKPLKATEFELFTLESRFTDDTVLTMATAEALLEGKDFASCYRSWGNAYPDAGYGKNFKRWLQTPSMGPYHSWGNGSAMRVSPVGFWAKNLEEALDLAKQSAEVTHNHPEGIKGAQAVASVIFLARKGASKTDIRKHAPTRAAALPERRRQGGGHPTPPSPQPH